MTCNTNSTNKNFHFKTFSYKLRLHTWLTKVWDPFNAETKGPSTLEDKAAEN